MLVDEHGFLLLEIVDHLTTTNMVASFGSYRQNACAADSRHPLRRISVAGALNDSNSAVANDCGQPAKSRLQLTPRGRRRKVHWKCRNGHTSSMPGRIRNHVNHWGGRLRTASDARACQILELAKVRKQVTAIRQAPAQARGCGETHSFITLRDTRRYVIQRGVYLP